MLVGKGGRNVIIQRNGTWHSEVVMIGDGGEKQLIVALALSSH